MQAQLRLVVGLIPIGSAAPHRRRRLVLVASSSSGEQNHYAVLGLNLSATSGEIKRAYRLLARQYHPDVSNDLKSPEVFKSIRRAYEVLSNEATRTQYDKALKDIEDTGRKTKRQKDYDSELDSNMRIYRWNELRRRIQHEKYWQVKKERSYSFHEPNEVAEKDPRTERGSFGEVLKSAFVCLFLLQTFGPRFSLTFSIISAFLDRKLDGGYKIGYVIAWVLGGRGGILLTLCLSFTSWVCGKTSSSIVALVVVATWISSYLARFAPLPQGALLTLLYMSIKLHVDLN